MNIVVIVKRIDISDKSSNSQMLDSTDIHALSIAVNLREVNSNFHKVSAICIAPYDSAQVIRECFAMGVDEGYLLDDPLFERIDLNGAVQLLSTTIKKMEHDLVLMSSPSTDKITPNIGSLMAENLKINHVDLVESFKVNNRKLLARRIPTARGNLEKTVDLPAMINLAWDEQIKSQNSTRIMKAFKKKVNVWNANKLKIDRKALLTK